MEDGHENKSLSIQVGKTDTFFFTRKHNIYKAIINTFTVVMKYLGGKYPLSTLENIQISTSPFEIPASYSLKSVFLFLKEQRRLKME